ncbi:MAG: murein biosynthesis integral membrane protein MurJ [Planctomycetes bacterium]|nr:murein biosynthesis integral membrane protein MurJ [Planctomycetota bacterium]
MACLICREHLDSRRVGERTELIFSSTLAGRGLFCDLRIPDSSVARKMAEVRRVEDGRYALIPLNGSGVDVNGQPLRHQRVLDGGDRIRLGHSLFEFQDLESEEAQPLPSETHSRASAALGFFKLVFGTLASRALGLAREVVAAFIFGAGSTMDIFFTAFTLPNLFRRVFGEMAMESAFLPPFQTYLARGQAREAWRLASTVCNLLALALGVIVLALHGLAPAVASWLAPGYSPAWLAETARLTRIMMPFTFFVGIAGFLGSVLLARGRYASYALAPTLFSVGEILGILLFYKTWGIASMAFGVVLGGAAQMLVQVHAFRRHGEEAAGYQMRIDRNHPGLRKVAALMGPIFLTSFVDKLGEVTKRMVASFLAAGSLSALTYAFRLVHLPFSVIGLALSRGVLPLLAEKVARNDLQDFRENVVRSLNLCSCLMIPTGVGVAVLAVPLVETVLAYGAWSRTNPEATAMTAAALVTYAVGLPFMSAVGMLTRAFHALLDTRSPLVAGVRGLYVNLILTLALGVTPLSHAGLALALTLDYVVQACLLLGALRRRLAVSGTPLTFSPILRPLLPITLASAAMGLIMGLAQAWLWPGVNAAPLARFGVLALLAGLGALTYGLAALLLKIPEAGEGLARTRSLWTGQGR